LTSLDGLSSLTQINGYFNLEGNSALTNVDGLSSLTQINGSFNIQGSTALTTLDGLSSLTQINGILQIVDNTNLFDISQLKNISSLQSIIISGNNIQCSLISEFIKTLLGQIECCGDNITSSSNNEVCDNPISCNSHCTGCLPNYYGPNCDQSCSCVNAYCSDGISGNGQCLSCLPNGINCDQNCLCVNGTCNSITGNCTCNSGFSGQYCEESVTISASSPFFVEWKIILLVIVVVFVI